MNTAEASLPLEQLNQMQPEELLTWVYSTYGSRAAIITSFQNTGSVIVDMAHQVAPLLRVITIDPLRLHQETYQFIARMEAHYGIQVERFKPDPKRLEQMIRQHGEFLFFDSKEKQEHCCHIRKVEPNRRALASVDAWITGLRRDQSKTRKASPKVSIGVHEGRQVVKVAPLVDWTEEQVEDYIRQHQVPKSPLYDQGYTSIGCMICTTPTQPGEDKRAGRWRWFNESHQDDHKECGIHRDGSGI